MKAYVKMLWMLPMAGLCTMMMPSCVTDEYGNTTVTPGGAALIGVGALAAGAAIGASAEHHHHRHDNGPGWGPPPPPPHPHHHHHRR